MIMNYGDQEFVVDFETDFIQRRGCYLDGNNCFNCPEEEECLEELHFVYDVLKGNE
jgi:hypothetical protein